MQHAVPVSCSKIGVRLLLPYYLYASLNQYFEELVRSSVSVAAARQVGEQRAVALEGGGFDRAGDVQGGRRVGGVDVDPAGRGLDRQRRALGLERRYKPK
jgi:hypothetical protein